jgi:hypothetical protein
LRKLRLIVSLLVFESYEKRDLILLKNCINSFVCEGTNLYSTTFNIPKMHQLKHIVKCIICTGPPIFTSNFPFGAMHKYVADGIKTNQNFEPSLLRRLKNVDGNNKMTKYCYLSKNGLYFLHDYYIFIH